MGYAIRFAVAAREQIRGLSARQRAMVIEAIERDLSHEPVREARQRKPLRPNPIAPWELRVGDLRVFYDVQGGLEPTVTILAVGTKRGNRLLVAGRELKL